MNFLIALQAKERASHRQHLRQEAFLQNKVVDFPHEMLR
jgi:hypothetical protein